MDAAAECRLGDPELLQQPRNERRMPILSAVARGDDRHFFLAEAKLLGRATRDDCGCLERLCRGPQENGLAPPRSVVAAGRGEREVDVVTALDRAAPQHVDPHATALQTHAPSACSRSATRSSVVSMPTD